MAPLQIKKHKVSSGSQATQYDSSFTYENRKTTYY